MRLRDGPLRLRLALSESEAAQIADLVAREGVLIVGEGEEADLVARPEDPPSRIAMAGPRLSAREIEVLDYLADGWSNAEIASVLGIGLRTVRSHLEGIYSKLGANRRGEAVREGVRLGLVSFRA